MQSDCWSAQRLGRETKDPLDGRLHAMEMEVRDENVDFQWSYRRWLLGAEEKDGFNESAQHMSVCDRVPGGIVAEDPVKGKLIESCEQIIKGEMN